MSPSGQPRPTPRIDAHHHLWQYTPAEFAWLDDRMAMLRRDFLIGDLESAMDSAGIDAAVAVQARESIEETEWLLQQAGRTPAICAVVGWGQMDSASLPMELERFAHSKKLVGYREIVQGRPAGYLDRKEFHRGIAQLTARNLSYDILIRASQLQEAIQLVNRHPRQRFILDHAAKPRIATGELADWAQRIRELASRQNVSCKLSGLVTEADWQNWSLHTLSPYLDVCVEAFGTERLLAGSDWPVCLVATTYSHWWSILTQYFASFSTDETAAVFGMNALQRYDIPSLSIEVAP